MSAMPVEHRRRVPREAALGLRERADGVAQPEPAGGVGSRLAATATRADQRGATHEVGRGLLVNSPKRPLGVDAQQHVLGGAGIGSVLERLGQQPGVLDPESLVAQGDHPRAGVDPLGGDPVRVPPPAVGGAIELRAGERVGIRHR